MTETEWLDDVTNLMPKILDAVNKCDAGLQPICFEILLTRAVNNHNRVVTSQTDEGDENISRGSNPQRQVPDLPQKNYHLAFSRFLAKTGTTQEQIENLIDIDEGHIHTREFSGAAGDQRLIACLLAVRNLALNGEMKFSREELDNKCKEHGVLQHNLPRNLKRMNKSYVVFQTQNNEFKVISRGEQDVATLLKEYVD